MHNGYAEHICTFRWRLRRSLYTNGIRCAYLPDKVHVSKTYPHFFGSMVQIALNSSCTQMPKEFL